MGQVTPLLKVAGGCARCRYQATFYRLTPGEPPSRPCVICHLPLALKDTAVVTAWPAGDRRYLLLTGEYARPSDTDLYRRREELLARLSANDRAALGLREIRLPFGLVEVLTVSDACRHCGFPVSVSLLTTYARRRLSCERCRRPHDQPRSNELHPAALAEDGLCYFVADLTPVVPLDQDYPSLTEPPELMVLSPDEMELLGIT